MLLMARIAAVVAALCLGWAATADGLPGRPYGKIASPALEEALPEWSGWLYAGVGAGYGGPAAAEDGFSWVEDGAAAGALYVGYWARLGAFGLGLEADLGTHPLEGLNEELPVGQWMASVRARGGVYLVDRAMLYATGGYAWDSESSGIAWGGGLELTATKRTYVRLEMLRYELQDTPVVARVGLGYRF